MSYRFNWSVILNNLPIFMQGLKATMVMAFIIMGLSFAIGLLLGIARISKSRVATTLSTIFTSIMRNTPLLTKIFFAYFGLAALGLRLGPAVAAIAAITAHESAYIAEIIRGGFTSVESSQMESALGIGMSWWQTMRRVIVPQVVHHIIPPCGNIFIYTVKDTSLASTIGLLELTFAGNQVHYVSWRTFEVYLTLAVLYLFVVTITVLLLRVYEKRILQRYASL